MELKLFIYIYKKTRFFKIISGGKILITDKPLNKYLYEFDEYILEYIKNYNIENQQHKIYDYQSVSVCTTNNTYSVLQIQPQAELIVDPDNGLYSKEKTYEEKIWKFIEKSFETNYDLVTTPEYSVPLETVSKLLMRSNDIESGTLYCLCCNGTTYKNFESFLKECEKQGIVCWAPWQNITNKNRLICCMLYVTKTKFFTKTTSFDQIFIIPQIKTNPMKDFYMDFEASSLSCGKKVVVFGKPDEVKFLSIICADVFKFDLISEIKIYLESNKAFIFHPQLNGKPQNDYFNLMRITLISYSTRDSIRILTLNWAEGTKFVIGNQKIPAIKYSWSALYEKYNNYYLNDYLTVFNVGAKHGLNIAHDYHLVSFYLSSKEHMIELNISRINNPLIPEEIQKTLPITIKKSYIYDYNTHDYKEHIKFCNDMINSFFKEKKEFNKLLICDKCCTENNLKCNLSKLNKFSSSIFNKKIEKEFEIISDGKNTSITSEHYSNIYTHEKLYICKRIYDKLLKGEVTPKFKTIKPNFNFSYSEMDSFIYNVQYTTAEFGTKNCRVIYLKYVQKEDAEKTYREIYNYNKEAAENLIIYYENEFGVNIYPECINTKINSPEIMSNNASILGG